MDGIRKRCMAYELIWLSYLCHDFNLIVSVNVVICAGARAGIKDRERDTPLKLAKYNLTDAGSEESRKSYNQVHWNIVDSHNCVNRKLANVCYFNACM